MTFRRKGETVRAAQIRALAKRKAKRAAKAARVGRPEKGPSLGRGWSRRAAAVRRRDLVCRRCGTGAAQRDLIARFPVDHIIPRRLYGTGETAVGDPDAMENLAMLCPACHQHKTFLVEVRLYRGDLQPFMLFLAHMEATGPIPDVTIRATAYVRARHHVETA